MALTAWGRLLQPQDADCVRHLCAMPLELLQGDGVDVRRELAQAGHAIVPGRTARELLASNVQVWQVTDRARCVDRLGGQGAVYFTPAESIGERAERVVFPNLHAIEPGEGRFAPGVRYLGGLCGTRGQVGGHAYGKHSTQPVKPAKASETKAGWSRFGTKRGTWPAGAAAGRRDTQTSSSQMRPK